MSYSREPVSKNKRRQGLETKQAEKGRIAWRRWQKWYAEGYEDGKASRGLPPHALKRTEDDESAWLDGFQDAKDGKPRRDK